MIAELPFILLVAGIVLVGLYLANRFLDLKSPQWLTRKVGHLSGFVGYLLSVYMFSSFIWPFILSISFTLLLGITRILKGPSIFRGVARTGAMAEVYYPLTGTLILGVVWGIFDKPFVAVACIGMMGAGDAITGIVRSEFCSTPQKHWSGSVAMLFCSLLLAWAFIAPFFIGAIAAVGATLAEWLCGDVGKIHWLDDNLAIPIISAAIAIGGLYALGLL